jgi:type I restriction enzyme, S subunit
MIETNSLPFDDVFRDVSSKANKLDQSEFSRSGKYPIIDQGQDFIAGYTDDSTLLWTNELPIIIFGDHTRIVKFIDFPFVAGADGTKVLEVDKNVDTKFAYFALQNLDVPSAGYSRHFKFLKEAFFRIPPLEQQRHIATILSRADRLRRLRKYALDISDSYLQGVFLEVFGDPSTNPKRTFSRLETCLENFRTGHLVQILNRSITLRMV